ncbi:MAG: alanine racemase [Acholeplasmataceae bacterium]|nr:alanine racemase [Acholeplasmataceae bacterium]
MINHYRPTWAEINLNHLWHNYSEAKKEAPNKEVIPVIKANAYGHGAIPIFKFLYQRGVRFFAVSLLEEALELRKVLNDASILMMGPLLIEDLQIASDNRIEFTIYDIPIYEAVMKSNLKLTCHLKIDSGMSRYGLIEPKMIIDVVSNLQSKKNIDLKGIYTHFATANENEEFYFNQVIRMKNILDQIKVKPRMIHMSNSSSTFKYEKKYDFTTHVRLGISLYGLSLDDPKPNIIPVMSLKSKVVQIKELHNGDSLGYGATYKAKGHEFIAILPIGYADGLIRKNKNGCVEINSKKYKIVGIICMDACFIKVDETVHVGDVATIFGGIITVDDIAKRLNTINYEVVTSVSNRVPRIMVEGAKI